MDEKVKVINECPICGRPTHKKSEYCIFHAGAQEKTGKEFKGVTKIFLARVPDNNQPFGFC